MKVTEKMSSDLIHHKCSSTFVEFDLSFLNTELQPPTNMITLWTVIKCNSMTVFVLCLEQ